MNTWLLACLIATPAVASGSKQSVFSAPNETAVRRYLASNELIELVEIHNFDVWYRNATVLDIYFPNSTSITGESILSNYVDTFYPTYRPPLQFEEPDPGAWDLSSLLSCTFHDAYHPVFEFNLFMDQLAKKWPNLVTVSPLGHSAEGQEMFAMKIARRDYKKKGKRKKGKKKKEIVKPGFVIQGAQHAREWIASATALYLAHALLVKPSVAGSLNHLLKDFDFYIIPAPNPDGYEYTWSVDRFWYKNRMIIGPGETCRGIDMNRNWGYKWSPRTDFLATLSDLCSHWYPGSRPFEAPEVNNIANYVSAVSRTAAFIDLRSYGQMISSPYSYSCEASPLDAEDLLEAAIGAAQAVTKVHGTHTTTGSLCEMLYAAPGNVVDWMYSVAGIKYSYAVHLRDTGTYGYALPADMVRPTGEETAKMVEYLSKFIVAH